MAQTPSSSANTTLYLIDISSFIFRAFFAIRTLHNDQGEPTNAVFGVATMLARLAEEAEPEYLAVVYDSKEPSFRKDIYPEYKANRSAPPDDLIPQFDRIEELIRAFDIHSYRQSGIEADDLIATLTKRWCQLSPKHHVVIVTSDKDLMQLVSPQVKTWDTMKNKFFTAVEVEEKFGVKPDQVRDYLALLGDSSDNIPGVPGIGPKNASELLKEFKTLKAVLTAAHAGKIPGKRGETLKNHEADALLSAQLATVNEDLELEIPLESLRYHFHVNETCIALLKKLSFHTLVNRWSQLEGVPKVRDDAAAKSLVGPGLGTSPGSHLNPGSKSGLSSHSPSESSPSLSGNQQQLELGSDSVQRQKNSTDSAHASFKSDPRFRAIQTEKDFLALLTEMERTKEFGFDLETTSLNPRAAEIVGVGICCDPERSYYIPIGHRQEGALQLPRKYVLDKLRPYLEDAQYGKIGQNLKYDWSVLREQGVHLRGIVADTMIAAYLVDLESRNNLKVLAQKYLDYTVLSYEQVCGEGKSAITFDHVEIPIATQYAAEDAWVVVELWRKLKPLLEKEGLTEIFTRVDLPLIQVLGGMELTGVCLDLPWLHELSQVFQKQLLEIEQRVQAFSSGEINLNSPKQLAHLLFETLGLPTQNKTKTGFSTDARVLEILSPLHEVPRLLLEYREISKLKGTYVDPLPLLLDPKTGRIHASFHQTVTATGRLSSSDPNLQNIPIRTERGTKIRRGFVASSDRILLSADYSQIELRLLAHMSQDPELLRAFREDEDVHRKTASDIFGIPLGQVDDRQRGMAKAINFGLMYGKTAFGLSQELGIPRKEAQAVIDTYFEKYRAVKDFLNGQIQRARDTGAVASLLGRRRKLPDIHSRNAMIRGNAERMAMNSPIQGTAADLIKLAMIEIDAKLEKDGFRSQLAIQVHDELVLDCVKEELAEIQKMVVYLMENAMSLSVPLKVNSAVGENWMEL